MLTSFLKTEVVLVRLNDVAKDLWVVWAWQMTMFNQFANANLYCNTASSEYNEN